MTINAVQKSDCRGTRRRDVHFLAIGHPDKFFACLSALRFVKVIRRRFDLLRNPQQPDKRRSAITPTPSFAGSSFFKQLIQTAAFVDRPNDPVRIVAGREEGRIGGVGFGIPRNFGVEGQHLVFLQGEEAPVIGCQVDLRTRQRDQDLAFEHRVTDFQFAHRAVLALGKNLALNSGNTCDGGIDGHDRSSRRND